MIRNRRLWNEILEDLIVNTEVEISESAKLLRSLTATGVKSDGRIVTEVNTEVNSVDWVSAIWMGEKEEEEEEEEESRKRVKEEEERERASDTARLIVIHGASE